MSSESGLHFGHYIAGIQSDHISHFHALKAALIMKRGVVLKQWARGLLVMLEKNLGCALITKLRSILLMEGDFNASNKIIFGQRMTDKVREHKLIPEEVYSERNRLAEDGTLAKVIFYEIVCQTRRPAGIAAVDADNCYDRIAHPIASLVFQSMGVPTLATTSLLTTIQDMKFYLCTGFGDPKEFARLTGGIKTQGLCQENGAAPAVWTTTNITIIKAHKQKDHGAHLINPISDGGLHVTGTIFVDDTDLEHFDMRQNKTAEEAHERVQESITNWGCLLIAKGGALKPTNCFYQLISFSWNPDGTWRYEQNKNREDYEIVVSLEDGTFSETEHLNIDTPMKMLGSMTAPMGSNAGAIKQMKDKTEAWLAQAQAGKLHKQHVWFLTDKQFWPKVGYGICTVSATFQKLEEGLMRTYYDMLSIRGVRKSVQKELQQMDSGFYGVGFPHPGVECLIGQFNKILTHYGSPTGLGKHMQVSMELLILEAGVSLQPFTEPYVRYSKWVTHSLLRLLWEKADMFQIKIEINDLPLNLPWVNDRWLMKVLEAEGYSEVELIALNRVRCYQQVTFPSDILIASGRAVDTKYTRCRTRNETWSTAIFPEE